MLIASKLASDVVYQWQAYARRRNKAIKAYKPKEPVSRQRH